MTDQEINEAVARGLGLKKLDPPDDSTGFIFSWEKAGQLACLPNFCTDIKAAWEIVDYVSRRLDPNGPLEETNHPDGRCRFVGNGFRFEHTPKIQKRNGSAHSR
jgi:hypothetical protein